VQRDYDYVWAYNMTRFSKGLERAGDVVFAKGSLRVYRLHRPAE
jgi:hypothetical protein